MKMIYYLQRYEYIHQSYTAHVKVVQNGHGHGHGHAFFALVMVMVMIFGHGHGFSHAF